MNSPDDLNPILDRVAKRQHTDADITALRHWMSCSNQTVSQAGKYAINFEQGQDIHIGDRIYQGTDAETIKVILRTLLQEIHNVQRDRNESRLLMHVRHEVNARLQQSLHKALLINLRKEHQAEQVIGTWDADVKIGAKPNESIASTTTILELFEQENIVGRLLILGNPGAGKTTTLLELAQALIDRAEMQPEATIPVVFNLSSWRAVQRDSHPSMQSWLILELKFRYGVRVDIGRKWFEQGRLLPMLDGLDELEPVHQKPCVEAINQWLKENPLLNLVVCCRRQDYQQLETKLFLNGAISLQPLTPSQVQDYFEQVGLAAFTSTALADPALAETLSSPLLLSISVLAYQGISIDTWRSLHSSEERLNYLFSIYVRQMLMRHTRSQVYRKEQEPNAEQTLRWLTWLAQQLKAKTQTEFLLEKMQPAYLTNPKQRWQYRLLLAFLGMGLIVGPIFGLLSVSWKLSGKQVIILFSFLMVGMVLDWYRDIRPIETLRISWRIPRKRLQIGFRNGLIFAFAGWLIGLGIPTPAHNGGIIGGIIGGLSATIVGCIDGELMGPDIDVKTYPNQGIYRSMSNSAIVALMLGMIFSSVGILKGNVYQGLSLGLIGAVSGGIVGGGLACLQHFTLRLVLWFHDVTPWNYARFLNYANERMVLQRVGGQYRFIHDLLREYFASGQALSFWHRPHW